MAQATPNPPWRFNLDGIFLGLSGSHPYQTEYLFVDIDEECVPIQLLWGLSPHLKGCLKPGKRVRVVGRSHLDLASKTVKLEAYQVIPLGETTPLRKPVAVSLPTAPKTQASQRYATARQYANRA